MSIVADAIKDLQQRRKGMRCAEVVSLLVSMGFKVRDGKRGGHKIFSHSAISGFRGGAFNCGHRSTCEIKACYVNQILAILNQYQDDLDKHLGEPQ